MKLDMNINNFINFENVFYDLIQQLGCRIYAKDNYYVFNEIIDGIKSKQVDKIEGEYDLEDRDDSILFDIINPITDRHYKICYNGEIKEFNWVLVYEIEKDNLIKNLNLVHQISFNV